MRRLYLFIVLVLAAQTAFSQLQVKEGSFKKVDGFVNINIEKMYDDNDKPYAVLKIKTENINDKQRHELGFGGDAQTFFEVEHKDGEVWLYISYYATFLKISHPDLSSTEFWFPYDMEPKQGYELTLVNKPAIDEEKIISLIDERLGNTSNNNEKEYGFIIINTTPVDGATVYIDGKEMEMKTPFVSDKIGVGAHKIQIIKDGYQSHIDIIKVDKDDIKKLDIKLEPSVKITSKNNKTNDKIPSKEKGFACKTELGIGYFVLGNINIEDYTSLKIVSHNDYYYGGVNFQVQEDIGYYFTPNWFVGFGVGFNVCHSLFAMPLYINNTLHIKNKFLLDIKLGYDIALNSVDQNVSIYTTPKPDVSIKDSLKGTFGSIGFGYEYRKSRFCFEVSVFEYFSYMTIKTDSIFTDLDTKKSADGVSFTLRYSYNIWGIK